MLTLKSVAEIMICVKNIYFIRLWPGSVSNLLVEEMGGFVLPLWPQEIHLMQFQEQIPRIKQAVCFRLYFFDNKVVGFYTRRLYSKAYDVYYLIISR